MRRNVTRHMIRNAIHTKSISFVSNTILTYIYIQVYIYIYIYINIYIYI